MAKNAVSKSWDLLLIGGRRYSDPSKQPGAPANAPLYFTLAPDSTWQDVPGTATGNINAVVDLNGGNPEPMFYAWTGLFFDFDNKIIYAGGMGGHADRAGGEFYALDLTQENCAFVRMNNASLSAQAQQVANSDGARGDGSRAADHNYNTTVYANGKCWFPAFGAMSGSSGWPSTAVWSFDPANPNSATLGYTYHGKAGPTAGGSHPGLVESAAAYDPVADKVWQVAQEASSGDVSYWSVDAITGAITPYTTGLPFLFIPAWVVCVPNLRILLAGGDSAYSNALWRLDLENPTAGWVACTESGTPRRVRGDGAVFHQAANSGLGKVYVYQGTGVLRTITIPSTANGTYTWGSATISGAAPTPSINGTWKKFGIIENMGGGRAGLFLATTTSQPINFIKVPATGF